MTPSKTSKKEPSFCVVSPLSCARGKRARAGARGKQVTAAPEPTPAPPAAYREVALAGEVFVGDRAAALLAGRGVVHGL